MVSSVGFATSGSTSPVDSSSLGWNIGLPGMAVADEAGAGSQIIRNMLQHYAKQDFPSTATGKYVMNVPGNYLKDPLRWVQQGREWVANIPGFGSSLRVLHNINPQQILRAMQTAVRDADLIPDELNFRF